MTQPERSTRLTLTEENIPRRQPKIWVEGRQRPPFDLAGFGKVSLAMAKRDLLPEMAEAAARLQNFGTAVSAGTYRLNTARLGKAARLVPTCQQVGSAISGLSALFQQAMTLISPPADAVQPLAYANLAQPRPVTPRKPQARGASEPTLHAIRTAITETAHDPVAATVSQIPTEMPKSTGGLRATATNRLWQAASWLLLATLMGFALPVGAIKAVLYHLNGGDLRDYS